MITDDTLIDTLEISVRAYNALKNAGLNTVGDIRYRSDSDLLILNNFGELSLRELRSIVPHAFKTKLVHLEVTRCEQCPYHRCDKTSPNYTYYCYYQGYNFLGRELTKDEICYRPPEECPLPTLIKKDN